CGGAPLDRSALARELIRRLDHWYEISQTFGCASLNHAWRDHSEHLGQTVQVTTPAGTQTGRLVDLDVQLGVTLALDAPADPEVEGSSAVPRLCLIPLADILALQAATDDSRPDHAGRRANASDRSGNRTWN